jgi:branched-chain amino acid transport system substrate-binding protein
LVNLHITVASRERGPPVNLVLKPNVIAFVAVMLLIASVTAVIDRPAAPAGAPIVAIDDPGDRTPAPGEDDPATTPTATSTDRPTDGDTSTPGTGAAPGEPQAVREDAGTADDAASDDPTPTTEPGGSTPGAPPAAPAPAPTATTPSAPPAPTGPPEANLFTDAEKTIGITDDTIRLCGHAALSLAAAFNTSPADLNVYWEMVRDQGGIHGRNVEVSWKDDAYNGNQAVTAAENCRSENPFLLLGGIGFDQIPNVRAWAEQNRVLYLHHIAVEPAQQPTYSFTLSPTVEAMGREFGNHIAARYRDKNVGIIYRESENWRPGRDAGRARMDAAGVTTVGDHGVLPNQGVYTQQLNDLRTKGAEVVWVWENALNAAQIINQATDQGYRPIWVVFPFQTTLDVLTNPNGLTIDGVASWPSYVRGGYGGAFPEWEFDQEIARFEAAYAKYRPNVTPNDLLWQVWVGNKVFHRMFDACGPDCNRNRFAGLMLHGWRDTVKPACTIDFSDPRSRGGHAGAFSFFAQELFTATAGPAYRTTRYCVPTLG